ncbi:diguanylate cyclase, partial [Candidatus Fermentibacteria bacterium]|nr:diguanylate cyclase [Candidatus Fermentibacteria bacterium]
MGSDAPQDRLTGLPTRAALDELDRGFRRRPAGEPWSALVIDVDDFKMINDVFGHLAGDRILQQVAYLLVRNVRQTDEAIRFGGDEFVVILRGTGKLQAANLAARFLEDVQRESFQGGVRVGVSLGLAESAEEDRALSSVLDKADRALYDSKARGKGKIAFFQDRSDREADLSFDHFVNRQAELKELRTALDEVLEKGCRAVLVTGEPGVGKTRLVTELRHYCAFRGCAFAEAKYDEVGGAEPFGLVLEPFRALVETLPEADREAVASSCGPVLPETAGLFPSLGLVQREGPLPPEWARGRVFYGDVAAVMRALTGRVPVTLLVDDLQWAHLQDLDLLGYIARSAGPMRLLIVMTARSPVEDYREAWSWLGVLRRFVPLVRIDLRPLDEEHAANMVMLALRDPQMPQEVLETITRQSGGNPYYIRELLKSLRRGGALEGGADRDYRLGSEKLPDGIAQLVRSRLDLLDPESREVLRMGALMPGSFGIDTVSFLLGIPRLRAARALDEPLRMGLVHEEVSPSGEPVCRFNHDCVRSCLLEELSASSLKALYSRLGRHYEWRWGKGEENLLAQVAYCYCESHEAEKAAEFALLAAEEAKARRAAFDQAAWLERFVRFAGASGKADTERLFEAWLELGDL